MITEDYCSYEVAEMLKEKGFDEQTVRCYNLKKELCNCQCGPGETINSTPNYLIAAPTHQMAMKWLREVHDCPIEILWHWNANSQCSEWYFVHHMELKPLPQIQYYDTYEEACEAAIKYCLENLI